MLRVERSNSIVKPVLFLVIVVLLFASIAVWSIFSRTSETNDSRDLTAVEGISDQNITNLRIVSGSENRTLEPIIERFNQERGVNVTMDYSGSVDILLRLNRKETADFDAVWPASSLILNMTTNPTLKHEQSILRSPVILGLKKEIAEELGWTDDNSITVDQLLNSVSNNDFRLAMTNAAQSNSGLSGYLAFFYAFTNSKDVLNLANVQDQQAQIKTQELLNSVDRSSGSSGWLKDLFLEQYNSLDAMINYESVIIETNQELEAQGEEQLQAIYLEDGSVISDSPLAYLDKDQPEKEELFLELQAYLASEDVSRTLQTRGRRTDIGLGVDQSDEEVAEAFRSEWGIKQQIPFVSLKYPQREVIEEMLSVYQVSLRKPSYTIYILDVSGSMRGKGILELKDAMRTIVDQRRAEEYFLQASSRDVSIVIPFNNKVSQIGRFEGNNPEEIDKFISFVEDLKEGGGTDMYTPLEGAYTLLAREEKIADYFTSIILMTDGKSDNSQLLAEIPDTKDTPVFSILFGDAEEAQLQEIVDQTGGRVFDGRESLVGAFRQAKGYN